jgi:hypothetical protein
MVEAPLRLTHRHHDPDALPVEERVREIAVHLHEVAIVRPTEPAAANLAGLHLVAELVARFDGVELSRQGPMDVGPISTPTSAAAQDDPVVIPWASLTGVGGAEPFPVAVPDGTEITLTVTGSERAAWLPQQHLGTIAITWTVRDTDPVDASSPMLPAKQFWQQSGVSEPGGYFRFRVCAVGPTPPAPRFDPHDVPEALGSEPMRSTRSGGSVLSFTYASPSWAGELALQRRNDLVQDSPWQTLPAPALVIGEATTATLTLPTSGRWRYRLQATNAAGSRQSSSLVVTIAS